METTTAMHFAKEARIVYEKNPGERKFGTMISDSGSASAQIRYAIGSTMVEHFVALALDSRQRVIGWMTIGIGGISTCSVDVGQLARFAVLSGAVAMVIGHNHPSGDPSPSAEDITLTKRVNDVSKLLGIRLLDHVIVADEGIFSFLDNGLLHSMK